MSNSDADNDDGDIDSDDYSIASDVIIYTPDELLELALKEIGITDRQFERRKRESLESDLKKHYGADSFVLVQIWEDLQTLPKEEDRLEPNKRKIKDFLMAMYFLKTYDIEDRRASRFHVAIRTARDNTWYMLGKIQKLMEYKIKWPDDNFGDDIWVISVDGTHFRSQEKRSATRNKDPRLYSFKHHCAGFNYELGLSLAESKLVWMKGPCDAGEYNDIKIFEEKGLKKKLMLHRKKCIADSGYRGFPSLISTPNNRYDLPEVQKFKSRARLRHERFNAMMKTFDCLDERFRHGKEKLCVCVECVAIVCQYKMEFGEQLYYI